MWGFPILLPQYPLRTGMTVSLARMMAPRIAVATSLEHLTPKPTCPSWSPIATKAWKGKVNYDLNNNTFPKLFKCNISYAINHRNLNKRDFIYLESGSLTSPCLFLHRHDFQNFILQRWSKEIINDLKLLQITLSKKKILHKNFYGQEFMHN